MRCVKTIRALALALALLCLPAGRCLAFTPYESFNFAYTRGEIQRRACPAPFYPSRIVEGSDVGVPLAGPSDIVLDAAGNFYVADSTDNAVYQFSPEWKLLRTIREVEIDGEPQALNKPQGLWVTEEGRLYIADTDNSRILVLDPDGAVTQVIGAPRDEVLAADYRFYPRKLAVDDAGRLFVVARDQFNGIMEFDAAGQFLGFIGSNKVNASPLQLFWKSILSAEQRDKMLQLIPMEYSSLCMDGDGFLLAVTKATDEKQKIKRLNPGGKDILSRSEYMEQVTAFAMMEDICADGWGGYYYLDNADGHVYAYNKDGYLLYAFGNLGEQRGTFRSPSAVEYRGGRLYVADAVSGSITEFSKTDYAQAIDEAGRLYDESLYDESRAAWDEVLRLNGNFELGYVQIGRILYRQERYREAMEYFKRGNFRGENHVSGYGMAFEEYRSAFLRENLGAVLSVGAGIAALTAGALFWRWRRKRKGKRGGDGA